MSYTVEKLPNEPIILDILNADYNRATDANSHLEELLNLLEAQRTPVYLIFDISEVAFSLDDIMQGIKLATKQYQVFKHSNIRENIFVTDSRFMKLASDGMRNPIFGSLSIRTIETRDAALAYARAQAASPNR